MTIIFLFAEFVLLFNLLNHLLLADINDRPQFSNVHGSLGVFGVEENSPVSTTVYVLSATDIDASDTLSYSWSSSPTSGLSYFTLVASSK
jgi:hypothetical protein